MIGQRLGAWVPLDEVPDVWAGVISIFRDYGYRRLRNRARLKFLVADWGIEKFREVLETQYLKRSLIDGPAPEVYDGPRDHVGVHLQNDGKFYVGINPTVGRVSGTLLTKLADLVSAHGSDRVRMTTDQGLVILDIDGDRVDSLVAGSARAGPFGQAVDLPAQHDGLHRASNSASSRSWRPRPAAWNWWTSWKSASATSTCR